MLAHIRNALKHDEENEGGFTLIELLVVVIIIGILAAIAIPTFLKQRENGYKAQLTSDLRNAATQAETFAVNNGGGYVTSGGVAMGDTAINTEKSADVTLSVASATANSFCIDGLQTKLDNTTDDTNKMHFLKADRKPTKGTCAAPIAG